MFDCLYRASARENASVCPRAAKEWNQRREPLNAPLKLRLLKSMKMKIILNGKNRVPTKQDRRRSSY